MKKEKKHKVIVTFTNPVGIEFNVEFKNFSVKDVDVLNSICDDFEKILKEKVSKVTFE